MMICVWPHYTEPDGKARADGTWGWHIMGSEPFQYGGGKSAYDAFVKALKRFA